MRCYWWGEPHRGAALVVLEGFLCGAAGPLVGCWRGGTSTQGRGTAVLVGVVRKEVARKFLSVGPSLPTVGQTLALRDVAQAPRYVRNDAIQRDLKIKKLPPTRPSVPRCQVPDVLPGGRFGMFKYQR
ncbi:unnamed protein product [Arctia plantaginis]|uniref:Uncharacterized protein n=1 Tax=Arctia plantaginis TaxID=874455 RepID=A0A8S0YW23_ARCPL|nr:unnamed protein product [Arctia plantaginis]